MLEGVARPKLLLTLAAVAVAVVGVGMVTYLSGGLFSSDDAEADKEAAAVQLRGTPDPAPVERIAEVTLAWNTQTGVALAEGRSSLEAAFGTRDGTIYVVDHTAEVPGARVRWYRAGTLAGSYSAPPGSLFFQVADGNLYYVIAKGDRDSERLHRVDLANGSVTEFVVPLEANSGGIRLSDDTTYVSVSSGVVDPDTQDVTIEDVLMPVSVGDRQVTDDEARNSLIEGWQLVEDGSVWSHILSYSPNLPEDEATVRRLAHGQSEVQIPYRWVPLGVDDFERAWVLIPPLEVSERGVPGWPARADNSATLLAVRADGAVDGALAFAYPAGLFHPDVTIQRNVSLADGCLALTETSADGLIVTLYEVRDDR
jgi:hypothetical protein